MSEKVCSTCKHFQQLSDDLAECRRSSPRYMGKEKNCFPRVSHEAWCGEWKTAQQSVQPTLESVRELPTVVIVSKSKLPAKSG